MGNMKTTERQRDALGLALLLVLIAALIWG